VSARKEASKTRVLEAIALFYANTGYHPSYRELGEYLGVAHSLVHGYVKELRADGLIDARDPKVSRALTLTPAGRELVSDAVNSWATKPSLD
jgi:Mn-dependent DtxR family transcriptional regulator